MGKKRYPKPKEIKIIAGESNIKLLKEILIKRFEELNNEIPFGGKIRNFNIQQNPHLFTEALKELIKNGKDKPQ